MLPRAQLKNAARNLVADARVSAYGVTVLYLAITFLLNSTSNYVTGSFVTDLIYTVPELQFQLPDWLLLPLQFDRRITMFYSVMVMLITAVLSAGYGLYHLSIHRRQFTPYSTLFDGFSFAGKIVVLQLLMTALLTAGFLLLVVPGVIMVYRYRFALYNLCENPTLPVVETLRMSAAQTRGRKWELFMLDLSFLGWHLLALMTMGLLNIWLAPYVQQTDIMYFTECKRLSGIGTFDSPEYPGESGCSGPDPFGR